MKIQDLKDKSGNELKGLLDDKRVELGRFRFQLNDRQLKNIKKIGETKRDIAKILTILNKK